MGGGVGDPPNANKVLKKRLDSPAYISLPTPENEKYAKNSIFRCIVYSTKLFTQNGKKLYLTIFLFYCRW